MFAMASWLNHTFPNIVMFPMVLVAVLPLLLYTIASPQLLGCLGQDVYSCTIASGLTINEFSSLDEPSILMFDSIEGEADLFLVSI